MNTHPIPDHIRQWAADHYDEHLCTEEVTMVALAYLAGQQSAAGAAPRVGGMTKIQSNAYAFLRCFIAEQGYCPSYEQIGTAIGTTSKGRVSEIVLALEEHGLLSRLPGRARSLSLNVMAGA